MTYKQNHPKRYIATVLVLLAVGAVTATGAFVLHNNRTQAAVAKKQPVGAAVPSKFSTAGVSGWWQGATRETDMALFENNHHCFTSVQYNKGTVDIAAGLKKATTSQPGLEFTATASPVLQLILQTNDGPQRYDLHQYTLAMPGSSEPLMHGLELGYVQLNGFYIKLEGHCNEPDQLADTLPALQSIKFDATK